MFNIMALEFLELEEYGFGNIETIYNGKYQEYKELELNFDDDGGIKNEQDTRWN